MVVRVAEAASRAKEIAADALWVATDHRDIYDAVEAHGFRAIMTSADHLSGTERITEVANKLGWNNDEIVVNVQGDEPLVEPALITALAQALVSDAGAAIATASAPIDDPTDFFNPNIVKVVCGADGRALYFSRAPIPWHRDGFAADRETLPTGFSALRHIGLYAYRVGFLRRYGSLAPSPLETYESLEQLRALWHGYPIRVLHCEQAPLPGVDSAEDLDRVRGEFDRRLELSL